MSKPIARGLVGAGAILLAILLTGCSDEPNPTPSPTHTPTPAPTLAPTHAPTPEPTPTPTPEPTPATTMAPANTPTPVPVNPAGQIPVAIPGGDGTQHSVFTPEEGGEAVSPDGSCTLNVPVGAVPNGEYVGAAVSIVEDDLSDIRYASRGDFCEVSVVDSSGDAVDSYLLDDPAEMCIPVPQEYRSRIVDVEMAAVEDGGVGRLLGSTIQIVGTSGRNRGLRRRQRTAGDRCGGCTGEVVAAGGAGDPRSVARFTRNGRRRRNVA